MQLSGKPGNVREFDNCQGNVRELSRSRGNCQGKILTGKTYVLLTWHLGQCQHLVACILRRIVLHYFTVIAIMFHYYTAIVHDVGNCNMLFTVHTILLTTSKSWRTEFVILCYTMRPMPRPKDLALRPCWLRGLNITGGHMKRAWTKSEVSAKDLEEFWWGRA